MSDCEIDINAVFDEIVFSEEKQIEKGYQDGLKIGEKEGNVEGYHLGYHKGAEVGRELGFYLAIVKGHFAVEFDKPGSYTSKTLTLLWKIKELIESFPSSNTPDADIPGLIEDIRAKFKRAKSLLKTDIPNPYMSISNQL